MAENLLQWTVLAAPVVGLAEAVVRLILDGYEIRDRLHKRRPRV